LALVLDLPWYLSIFFFFIYLVQNTCSNVIYECPSDVYKDTQWLLFRALSQWNTVKIYIWYVQMFVCYTNTYYIYIERIFPFSWWIRVIFHRVRQIIHIFHECEARVNKFEFICITRWNLTPIHQEKGNFLFSTFFSVKRNSSKFEFNF